MKDVPVTDMIHYNQSKILHSLLAGAKKTLNRVEKAHRVPVDNIYSHNTRTQNLVYEVIPSYSI